MKIRFQLALAAILCTLALYGCSSKLPPEGVANTNDVQELRTKFASLASATEGDSAEAVAGPTGFATLKGRFTLTGAIPQKTLLNISKDQAICAPGGSAVYANDIQVDESTKGIANVVIYAEVKNEEWVHESAKKAAADEVPFDQQACVFLTRVVAMQTSQKLKAMNSDPVGHNLNVKNFNKTIESGKFLYFQPEKQDKIPTQMSCSIHPWMKAYFLGRDDGYFAVTKPDGSFEIANVPAGVKLDFRVWHERAGSINGTVNVNGSEENWKKGKFSKTLVPESVVELEVALGSDMF